MSKRSRQYFESYFAFNELCEQYNIGSSPKNPKRPRLNDNADVDKKLQHESIVSLPASPSPPQILLNKISNKHCTNHNISSPEVATILHNISLRPPSPNHPKYRNKTLSNALKPSLTDKRKVLDGYTFYLAHIGVTNTRTGVPKHWSDLNKNRCRLFNILIPKHGGRMAQHIANINANTTGEGERLVIIVSEYIKRSEFDALFCKHIRHNERIVFVTPEYITESFKYQNRLSFEQFKPKCMSETDVVMTNVYEEDSECK
eukprot:121420_1